MHQTVWKQKRSFQGKHPGEGPKRNTLAEAEEDGVEVKKVISPGKDEDAIWRDAEATLRQLATAAASGKQDLADFAAREKQLRQDAKQVTLSEAARMHSTLLNTSFEIQRIRLLAETCAQDYRLQGICWSALDSLLPRLGGGGP